MSINIFNKRTLPREYQELEYIESTGTQFVDTGVKVSDLGITGAIEWDIASPSNYSGYILMGSYYFGSTLQAGYRNTNEMSCNYGFSEALVYSVNKYQFNKIYVSNGTQKLNGEIIGTFQTVGAMSTNTQNLLLFGRTDTGITTLYPSLLKGAKIWDNQVIIRDFIPCYRKADGVIGIYDAVNGVFYTNSGTGVFGKGPLASLPDAYQQVEYIESTGTQYINSGIIGKYGLSSYAKLSVSSSVNDNAVLLASRITDAPLNDTRIYLGYRQFNGTVNVGYKTEILSQTGVVVNTVQEYEYSLNDNYAKVKKDGNEIISEPIVSDYSNNTEMYIFGNNYNGFMNPLKCKLYSLKVYDNNTLVRDYIPCYRRADHETGLFDLVNSGKNLMNMSRTTFDDITKQPADTVKFDYNKLYYMASSGYIRQNAISDLKINSTAGSVSFTAVSSAWWGVGMPIEVKPNTKYTISATRQDGNKTKVMYALYNADGTFGSYEQLTTNVSVLNMTKTITTGANVKTMVIVVAGVTQGDDVYAEKIQVEEAQSATTFEPYPFYINAGTGGFYAGDDVSPALKKLSASIFTSELEDKIPDEYQEVEYIESTGTQYIDTEVTPDNSTGLKVVFSDLAVANRDFNFIGSRLQSSSRFMINYTDGNFGYGWDSYYTTNEDINVSMKNIAELNFYNNRNFIANGNTLANLSTIAISNMPTIYIFGQHSQNNNLYSYKVYECEITQDELLIRKFIPCYRKADNVIGLYDKVNDVFYTNSGTGTFTKGANINFLSDYQELEYIESDGDQYIDTQLTCDQDSRVEVQFSADTTACGLLGYQQSGVGLTMNFSVTEQTNSRWGTFAYLSYNECLDGTPHIIEFSKNGFYDNGVLKFTPTQNNFTTGNMYVGKIDGAQTSRQKKIYYCKFYDNNVLVRDLIPVLRKRDGVLGLLDKVNNIFYTNAGTGTFVKGPDKSLPIEFQQVEYLESTGTQYIDTGVKLENNSYCNIDFKYSELQYQMMGGNTETTQRYFIGIKSTLDLFYFGTGDTNNYYGTADTNRHSFIIDMPNSKVGVDDNYSDVSFTFTNNDSSHNFYLFARINSAGQIVNNCAGRLYRALFKHNNSVIRNFIPCYRKSDNTNGLYDLVTGTFYTNAGTGTFNKGIDVFEGKTTRMIPCILNIGLPDAYQQVEYLQSSGTQYIDTGIKLSSADTVNCKFEILSSPSDYSSREGIYGTMEYISGANTFFVLLMRTPNLARVGTSSNQVTSTNVELNTIYDTSLSNGTYIENGITYTFTPHNGFAFTTNCYLFKRNQSSMLPTSAKVYSFEIVGKFKGIPCYRKADNVAGFYDLITQTFFTNAGTGTFIAGPINIVPDEYQRIDYLELDSVEPQTTGILLNTNYTDVAEIHVKYEMTNEVSSAGHPMILCAHAADSFTSTTPYVCADSNSSGNIFNTNYTTRDNINNPIRFIINARNANSGLIKIGGWNDIYWTAVGRYYFVTIYDSNLATLLNLLPCIRKADGVIGLYDAQNDIFYTNGGTGSFSAGENISNPIPITITRI